MNKLKLAIFASIFASTIVSAGTACEGFQIRLKNNLADDLLVTSIKLQGANIQPGVFEKLNSRSEQVFTINQVSDSIPMNGEFTLRTLSLPSKTVKINYSLENNGAVCEHTDKSPASDYPLEKTRKLGEVQYAIQ